MVYELQNPGWDGVGKFLNFFGGMIGHSGGVWEVNTMTFTVGEMARSLSTLTYRRLIFKESLRVYDSQGLLLKITQFHNNDRAVLFSNPSALRV